MREFPKDSEGRFLASVLLVEDNPFVRAQLQQLVARHVVEVRVAADGAAGLEMWRSWRPDLVITDIQMPNMDGLEMSEAIKREDASASVGVALYPQDGMTAEALLEAADAALYTAKRSGRGCVRYYSQASDQATASA